ncbi:MAG: lytic transglycosylase domain-containing protein [Lachnospiraceae bacterium]|nr:lytic transglycosylase domain-containing protein [Lachnospiraceae bacterium]
MLFIEGLGYVNEAVPITNQTNVTQTSDVKNSEFEKILEEENANYNTNEKTYNLEAIFKEASETYGISEDLLKAIAYNESRFQPGVTSSAGAMGIMQLMPGTAKAMGVEDAYDPYQNIMGGAKLLNYLSNLYDGNTSLMIAAYAAGTGTVAKYGGIPPLASVNGYIAKIYNTMDSGIAQNVPDLTYTVNTSGAPSVTNASNTSNTSTAVNAANSSGATNNANSANTEKISDSNSNKSASGNTQTSTINPYAYSNLSSSEATAAAVLAKTGETETTNIYDYRTGNSLNSLLSYSEYDLLISFYENMLDIIAKLGDTDSSTDDNDYMSSYLYNNLSYTKNNINMLSSDSLNILKNIEM